MIRFRRKPCHQKSSLDGSVSWGDKKNASSHHIRAADSNNGLIIRLRNVKPFTFEITPEPTKEATGHIPKVLSSLADISGN